MLASRPPPVKGKPVRCCCVGDAHVGDVHVVTVIHDSKGHQQERSADAIEI
jgi:hypothetical protein